MRKPKTTTPTFSQNVMPSSAFFKPYSFFAALKTLKQNLSFFFRQNLQKTSDHDPEMQTEKRKFLERKKFFSCKFEKKVVNILFYIL